jgi:hypothetical protein
MPLKSFLPKRRHFIAMAIFIPLLLFIIYLSVKNSLEYKVAEQFVAHDPQVTNIIGKVHHTDFKFWSGFESIDGNGGHAKFRFNAVTDQGVFTVQVYLICSAEKWQVKAVDIYTRNGVKISP